MKKENIYFFKKSFKTANILLNLFDSFEKKKIKCPTMTSTNMSSNAELLVIEHL